MSDTDFNALLFEKLFSKLTVALGVADVDMPPINEQSGESLPNLRSIISINKNKEEKSEFLLAIYNPGQYIPPDLDPEKNNDDLYTLSVLFDVVPKFSWTFKPAKTTVSNAYRSVLMYKEVPNTHLNEQQKADLISAKKVAGDLQKDYELYMNAYLELLDKYDVALANSKNKRTPVPRSLKEKLKQAHNVWVQHGKKDYETAIATINYLSSIDVMLYWEELQNRYNESICQTNNGIDFAPMGFAPSYKSWFEDAGWTTFTFDQEDYNEQETSNQITAGGNLKGDFGIVAVSGEGDYTREKEMIKIKDTQLTFSCELMRVSLDRQWMNPLVFDSKAWRWFKGSPTYGEIFSTGGGFNKEPTGEMTVIPTAAILSRNLTINGTFQDEESHDFMQTIDANASIGVGPFTINGHFHMGDRDWSQSGNIGQDTITAPDVQIIALICDVLNKSPDPDTHLPWPENN